MPSLCALPLVSADGIPSLRIDVSAPVGSREEGLRSQSLGVRSSQATIESAQIETYFSVSLPTPSQLLYQIRCIRSITAFEFLLSICALVVFQSIPTVLPSFFFCFPIWASNRVMQIFHRNITFFWDRLLGYIIFQTKENKKASENTPPFNQVGAGD